MDFPRIKPMHNPIRLSQNRIRIGTIQYGIGSEIQDDAEGHIWQLLKLMDGTRRIDTIVSTMLLEASDFEEESIYLAIETLIESGFVEDASTPPPDMFTPEELDRYSRNANYFAWIDTQPRPSRYEIQKRLKCAHVAIAGLGGSGSATAMSLVAAGVGNIHCIDFDRVEESNLSRQLLYTEDDLGLPKVEQAISHLRRLNKYVTVTGQELRIQTSKDLIAVMNACDLFILCADEPPLLIQQWTNEAALQTRTPWLISLYAGPMLVTGLFLPFQTPCHQCIMHYEDEVKRQVSEEEESLFDALKEINGVIAPTAGLTGHFGALEAVYFLTDLHPQTVGQLYHQNLMIYDHTYRIKAPFWAECPACGSEGLYRKVRMDK